MRRLLAGALLAAVWTAFCPAPCRGADRVLCDFEKGAEDRARWRCWGGTLGVQTSIVHGGGSAGLWVARGFSHLHLRGLDPRFEARSQVTLWVWCEEPLEEGLYLALGQSTDTFAVAPLPLQSKGWNGFSLPLLRMASEGLMDWDLVALCSLVYTGAAERTFVIDDFALSTPEAPTRSRNPREPVRVDPGARRFVVADFEKEPPHVYFERSSGGRAAAPRPVRKGERSYRWTLVGERPFLHFGAVPRDLGSFRLFQASLYLEAEEPLSLHVLFCTTDEDNFQEEIRLSPKAWTDVRLRLRDMLPVGKADWRDIRAIVFTIGGRRKATVYLDDLLLLRSEEPDEPGGGKEDGR